MRIQRSGGPSQTVARILVLAAAVLLVLDSAGTLQVGVTLTMSYLCLAAACVVGWAAVIEGWRCMPRWLQGAASGLVLIYVISTVTGDQQLLVSSTRGGSLRGVTYVVDLIVGLAVIGLIRG